MTDIPDLCEPILGWRYWRVESGYLVSGNSDMGSEVIWPPYQRLVARHYQFHGLDLAQEDSRRTACRMAGPPCPEHHPRSRPGCGLYAATEEMLLRDFSTMPLADYSAIAIGRVALWGRVAVHTEGWRGQYAYPHELVYITENVDGPALATTYGISLKEHEPWKLAMKNGALSQNRSYLLSLPVNLLNLPVATIQSFQSPLVQSPSRPKGITAILSTMRIMKDPTKDPKDQV